jgi:dihydrofolate reductase
MGRKTYDSVPASLRPLAKRISVVVSRDTSGSVKEGVLGELERRKEKIAIKAAEAQAAQAQAGTAEKVVDPVTDAIVETSLDAALLALESKADLGKVFVIGGAEIYNATLGLKRGVRVVMTNVVRRDGEPFECDTFFPVDSFEGAWRTASPKEVSEWVGEEVDGEWKVEGDVEVQMVGFERI